MLDWNPALYRRFEDERTRPAQELLARVPLLQATHVVDLGCGPGNSTELLCTRFPEARVYGVDNSPSMLQSAAQRLPDVAWELASISDWTPEVAPDLIFANASLQWVGAHETLIPRLFSLLAPGGVLAIQMPDNRQEPTHRLMREVAAMAPWRDAIGDPEAKRTELLGLPGYYDLLAGATTAAATANDVDVWHTIYQHRMDSAAAIVDWVRSTGLRPYIDPLPDDLRQSYLREYEARVDQNYAVRADGQRLLAFPRLFIVAQRAS